MLVSLAVTHLREGSLCDHLCGCTRMPSAKPTAIPPSTTLSQAEASRIRLESGDALVFGGPARMLFHAVPVIHSGTAPQELLAACGLRQGRLNLTLRQT